MPSRLSDLTTRPHRHGEHFTQLHVLVLLQLIQRTEHILIRGIITSTEHKVEALASFRVFFDQHAYDLALIESAWPELEVVLALHDFDRVICEGELHFAMTELRHVAAETELGAAVMPGHGDVLAFDEGSCAFFGILLENALGDG